MSIVLRKTFAVEGTPTDVTSFTVGVVRLDTGVSVVTAGTAMAKTATGKYEHTFAEPAASLSYEVSYSLVYNGSTTAWEETITGSAEESIPLPELTGDYLVDTINSLIVERLRVSRSGPKVTYNVHGKRFDWNEYTRYLDSRIMHLRREIAMASPFEEISVGF